MCVAGMLSSKETKKQCYYCVYIGKDGKTTSKSGLAFNGTSHYGKLRTKRSGGSWL